MRRRSTDTLDVNPAIPPHHRAGCVVTINAMPILVRKKVGSFFDVQQFLAEAPHVTGAWVAADYLLEIFSCTDPDVRGEDKPDGEYETLVYAPLPIAI